VGFEALAGTFVLMWVTRLLWPVVDRGHYRAAAWCIVPLVVALSFALPRGFRTEGFVVAGVMAAFLVAVYAQWSLLEMATGALASAASVWLVLRSASQGCGGCGDGVMLAVAGTFFLGAVTHAMVLGHWYLNQPRLPIEPLKGATYIMLASLAVAGAAGLATRGRLLKAVLPGLVAFSSSGYWWAWLLLLAGTAALGVMVRSTVWTRSTQSATGLLYIAVLTALGAQFLVSLLVAP
jgi:protein NrfD